MFEVGFTEILLILGLALLVLGPEKLPALAAKVGRWTGRARAMARQLRTQLEHEVTMDELTRSRPQQYSPPPAPSDPSSVDMPGSSAEPVSPEASYASSPETPPDAPAAEDLHSTAAVPSEPPAPATNEGADEVAPAEPARTNTAQ